MPALAATALAALALATTMILLAGRSAGSPRTVTATSTSVLYPTEQLLIAYCMQANGFSFRPALTAPVSPEELFPYGITSLAWARQHGFGRQLVADDQGPATASDNEYGAVLDGPGPNGPGVTVRVPTGEIDGHSTQGCRAYAEGVLYGNYASWFKLDTVHSDLSQLVQQLVQQNPAYQESVSRWSHCMSGYGYSFGSPAAAMDHFLTGEPAPAEADAVKVASTESTCLSSVGMTGLIKQLTVTASSEVHKQYAAVLQAYDSAQRRAVPAAYKILGTLCKGKIQPSFVQICDSFAVQ